MQAAIVALTDPESEYGALEFAHAMAIAAALQNIGIKPFVIAAPNCATGTLAAIKLANQSSLLSLFKLWRWQRGIGKLVIIAIGDSSSRLAARLLRMGRKKGSLLIQAHFLLPPRNCEGLAHCSLCLCGSTHIAEAIQDRQKSPPCVEIQPGLDLCSFQTGRLWQEGERFIFGMAESLMPDSGALLVIRAMAALWQHKLPDWEVRMFGYGPRFEEVKAEAEKMGVLSRLAIFGTQPLAQVVSQCHVWLAPGESAIELPETLWAGIAAGLPLICTRSKLHSERLFNHDAALQVTADNPQDLAKAMLALMRSNADALALHSAEQKIRPMISLNAMGSRVNNAIMKFLLEINQTDR